MEEYDKKVLIEFIKITDLNATLIHMFDFIPIALKFDSVKTIIIEKMLKESNCDGIDSLFIPENNKFNEKASELMKSINTNISKFENYKYTDKLPSSGFLVKYIDLFIYKNKELLLLPTGMVDVLKKNLDGSGSGSRSRSRKTVDLTVIDEKSEGKNIIDISNIFYYLKLVLSYVSIQDILSFALGIVNTNIILSKLKQIIDANIHNLISNFKNFEKFFIEIKTKSTLNSLYDSDEFKNAIDTICKLLNLDTLKKASSSQHLYQLQIVYSFCLKMLNILVSSNKIGPNVTINLPEIIVSLQETTTKRTIPSRQSQRQRQRSHLGEHPSRPVAANTELFYIPKDIVENSKIYVDHLKDDLFKLKFPAKDSLSIYLFNILLLVLHSIFISINLIKTQSAPQALLRQNAFRLKSTKIAPAAGGSKKKIKKPSI